jgi:hypothetical protein
MAYYENSIKGIYDTLINKLNNNPDNFKLTDQFQYYIGQPLTSFLFNDDVKPNDIINKDMLWYYENKKCIIKLIDEIIIKHKDEIIISYKSYKENETILFLKDIFLHKDIIDYIINNDKKIDAQYVHMTGDGSPNNTICIIKENGNVIIKKI